MVVWAALPSGFNVSLYYKFVVECASKRLKCAFFLRLMVQSIDCFQFSVEPGYLPTQVCTNYEALSDSDQQCQFLDSPVQYFR